MAQKTLLIEAIDEITANSVTPEEFKETTGYTLEEYVDDVMARIHDLERKKKAQKVVKMKKAARPATRPAALPAAAERPAAAATGIGKHERAASKRQRKDALGSSDEI